VSVLKTRMQPVGSLFDRFPRMVRDLSRQLGKEIELVTVGQEVELDKTVLEQLSDPLIHLIRNSIDHGLETPRVRLHAGKPRIGKVTLSAKTADGQVVIEVRDDGRGIDPNAVRTKVLSLGLKTEAELQKISPKELYSYILLPGFSTAKQVSDVSGRGVGMDVVRTNIERLEGSLTIDSKPGKGTSMVMRVPLTLAIIPCLIVTVGEERFAVPQRGLEEIVCLYPGGQGAIEHAYDTEMYRLREVLLPVVRYAEVLKRPKPFTAAVKYEIMAANKPADRDPKRIEYILVLRTGDRKFGLLVDDVRGTVEVVVKPMHPSLKKLDIFAGATLMGDGCVSLISNIEGIAEHAGCFGVETIAKGEPITRDAAEVHRVLLFEYGPAEQFAVPLVQVRRIESISMDKVEHVGNQSFITIEGVATRIVHLDKYLNVSSCVPLPEMHLLLPKFVREPMGILVSRIIDSESLAIEIHEVAVDDPGILGTAIVRGRLALFLDTQYLREQIFGSAADKPVLQKVPSESVDGDTLSSSFEPTHGSHRLLLVDDTRFFREVVKRYFEREGLSVVTAVDGKDGMRKLASETFDLVVSDIEMPIMNGWQFCAAARKEGIKTKFLALSSLNKAENESRAKACGFDGFEEKLNHDRLIVTVRKLLGIESEEH
ncbi:MAG TPA: hybrid sensor histidine kinase/response regulator, partial [Pirellula sp.]|nr:hybrid sensor histidine kinase/response regulator [Pirellula sp.]